jgi:hypothetical protein
LSSDARLACMHATCRASPRYPPRSLAPHQFNAQNSPSTMAYMTSSSGQCLQHGIPRTCVHASRPLIRGVPNLPVVQAIAENPETQGCINSRPESRP